MPDQLETTKLKVSILIPCYNAERFVCEAVESALNQTHTDVEVVVVDDGSTDDSVEVLKSFGSRIILEAARNSGACAARNRAFELSTGEYIQYLDADDMLVANKLERQLEVLKSQPVDITFCKGFIFDDGKPERPKQRPISELGAKDPFVYCLSQGLATEGPLIRRTLIERVDGFDTTLKRAQEWDFHLRLCAAGARLHFQPELLYRHRHDDRPDRITKRKLDGDFFARHLIRLGRTLATEPQYEFTSDRRLAFCDLVIATSVGVFQKGFKSIAKEGIALVHELCPDHQFQYQGSGLYNQVAKYTGVLAVESFLGPIRSMRDAVRKMRGSERTK